MLLKKNDINKFSILFLRWGITQCIQAKGGFQAPVQCFSLSTELSLQRIDELKTNGKQYSCYLYSIKGEKLWSSDCETCFMQTLLQEIHLPCRRTMRQLDMHLGQAVCVDIRPPSASQYFYSLHHQAIVWKACFIEFQWLHLLSLPCCCVRSQLDGAHGVAASVQS